MKTKGLVKFTGSGKPALLQMTSWLVMHPRTKDKTMICTNNITVSYFCCHGNKCNFLHLFKLNDLATDKCKVYSRFVEKTSDLEWVNKPKTTAG